MPKPDHQIKETTLRILSQLAVAVLYGTTHWYGASNDSTQREVRAITTSTQNASEQLWYQTIPWNAPLSERIKQNRKYVIDLAGFPSADDLGEIRWYCGPYTFPARKVGSPTLPLTTKNTANCAERIRQRQVYIRH